MDNWSEGREGERIVRKYLKRLGVHYFQADLMAKIGDQWYIIEIKRQEMFKSPPFDGHGLPRWQIEARLKFQDETGIRAMLFIVDKISGLIYWQYMDALMDGGKYQTQGTNPRLIFPLTSYNCIKDR